MPTDITSYFHRRNIKHRNDVENFVKQHQHVQISTEKLKSVWSVRNFNEDEEELWLLQCPRSMNINQLLGKKLELADNENEITSAASKQNFQCTSKLLKTDENNRKHLTFICPTKGFPAAYSFPQTGIMTIRPTITPIIQNHNDSENILTKNSTQSITYKTKKIRHPLFGADYQNLTKIDKRVSKKLAEIDCDVSVKHKKGIEQDYYQKYGETTNKAKKSRRSDIGNNDVLTSIKVERSPAEKKQNIRHSDISTNNETYNGVSTKKEKKRKKDKQLPENNNGNEIQTLEMLPQAPETVFESHKLLTSIKVERSSTEKTQKGRESSGTPTRNDIGVADQSKKVKKRKRDKELVKIHNGNEMGTTERKESSPSSDFGNVLLTSIKVENSPSEKKRKRKHSEMSSNEVETPVSIKKEKRRKRDTEEENELSNTKLEKKARHSEIGYQEFLPSIKVEGSSTRIKIELESDTETTVQKKSKKIK